MVYKGLLVGLAGICKSYICWLAERLYYQFPRLSAKLKLQLWLCLSYHYCLKNNNPMKALFNPIGCGPTSCYIVNLYQVTQPINADFGLIFGMGVHVILGQSAQNQFVEIQRDLGVYFQGSWVKIRLFTENQLGMICAKFS